MTEAGFKDHFSGMADAYARFRPGYPDQLFIDLASRVPARRLAWDCGCGGGQATRSLANHFDAVIATDPSADQVSTAPAIDNVRYAVAAAESAPEILSSSVDLILAAQAAHWFDLPRFYAEVRRVAAPGALLALVTYRPTRIDDATADAVLQKFYIDRIGPYWPPERRHVDQGYAEMDFPFPEIVGPDLVMDAIWDLDWLIGYIGTWSAVKEFRRKTGADPLPDLRRELAEVWGDPADAKRIYWPLACRLGHVS